MKKAHRKPARPLAEPVLYRGQLMENGRVKCIVMEPFGCYVNPGMTGGFTPGEIEAEMRRRRPRFRLDSGPVEDGDDLSRVPGITGHDAAVLNDRGIHYLRHLLPQEKAASWLTAALQAYYGADAGEEGRRRQAIRHFHERVADFGMEGALLVEGGEEDLEDHSQALNDALVAVAEAEAQGEDVETIQAHLQDADLEALEAPLKAAYAMAVGSPGNRKLATLAAGLVKAIEGSEAG